ncbi:hypothetical protein E2562_034860 [Oryza meyeriana var. granulata]|uniref:Uncharacterized protein n=1 Tax=Oryza meyeriana var. granulata TaxID=110450 RepID=A0A6G1E6R3_9ORYZ|nr:hypothetical protein E2562_034860 [Oryza meyeriana var. granulata]
MGPRRLAQAGGGHLSSIQMYTANSNGRGGDIFVSACFPLPRWNRQTLAAAMPISTAETRMPSHRRFKRSSEGSRYEHQRSPARADASRRNPSPAMRFSSTETATEITGHGRRSKRSSSALSLDDASASYPT